MVKLKDIAERASVSIATVSYVLNNTGKISQETREKVLRILQELNYKPNQIARSLKVKKTSTIGVIVEDITVFNAPEIIDGINQYAEELGFSILLTNLRIHKRIGNKFDEIDKCKDLISSAMDELLGNQVDGIIYIGVHIRDVTALIPKVEKPVVYTYCYTTSESDYSVNFDDELGAYEATKYLIKLGHRNIALISGLIDSVPTHQRLAGYHRALMESQLSFNPIYIKTGDWTYESGYALAKELLKMENTPTAILSMNDHMAGGVLEACRELGISVPRDISVVGYDNQECSKYYMPKLTTMKLPLNEMGALSIKKMVELINSSGQVEGVSGLRCELVERDSVSTPKV